MRKNITVAEQRNYRVLDVNVAKQIALIWLQAAQLENVIGFGLPEIDDRYLRLQDVGDALPQIAILFSIRLYQ